MLVGLGIGALVLVPSLVLLYRLVLRGTLDQEFEPLDQRFRPREASDADGGRREARAHVARSPSGSS